MNEVESDIDDWERDIGDCDQNLDVISEPNYDSGTEISDDDNDLNKSET